MKQGLKRFEYYLDKLQALLDKAGQDPNPAQYLYSNQARTILFMLEGLSKLYSGIHNEKKFSKLKEHFKLLEDGLGAIDHYDQLARDFSTKENTAALGITCNAMGLSKMELLNALLVAKNWIGPDAKRMKKIREKLMEADWLNPAQESEAFRLFYTKAIDRINAFINQRAFHFDNIEEDVHELRRMIRWLSIYPQALRGGIQLSALQPIPAHLDKYLVPEITGSAFNIMPDAGENKHFLLLEKNHFYALSWLIAELGKMKDSGLKVTTAIELMKQKTSTEENGVEADVYGLLGQDQRKIEDLLDRAELICKTFTEEHNLDKLLIGTAAVH